MQSPWAILRRHEFFLTQITRFMLRIMEPDGAVAVGDIAAYTTAAATGTTDHPGSTWFACSHFL